jgi:uncharacterized repeat protein (TIGR01451 family)
MKLRHCLLGILILLWLVVLPMPAFAVVEGTPDLYVTKDDGLVETITALNPGDTITYTITYGNEGDAATNPRLIEIVPQYTTFDSGNSTQGWNCMGQLVPI